MVVVDTVVEKQLTASQLSTRNRTAGIHARTLRASLQTLMLERQRHACTRVAGPHARHAGITEIEVLRRDGKRAFRDLATVTAVNK